jgi:hypothetical protein
MRDYEFSRLCYDIQSNKQVLDAYRADPESVLSRYELKPGILDAIRHEDAGYLASFTNPVLLRYFFFHSGMSEAVFITKLRAAIRLYPGEHSSG